MSYGKDTCVICGIRKMPCGANTRDPTIVTRFLLHKYMVYYGIAGFHSSVGTWFNTIQSGCLKPQIYGCTRVWPGCLMAKICVQSVVYTRGFTAQIHGTLQLRPAVSLHKYMVNYGTAEFHCGTGIWLNTYSPVVAHDYRLWSMSDARGTNTRDPIIEVRYFAAQIHVYYGTLDSIVAALCGLIPTVQLSRGIDTWVY